jgi:signal transduction histidine kinase
MICNLFTEPSYFIYVADAPKLLYYSHIPTSIIALLLGAFVFWYGRKSLLNRLFFLIALCFVAWTSSNLILWTNIHSDFLLFIWSLLRVFSSILSILCIYFIYVFLEKKDVSFWVKLIFLALLLPVLIFAPTVLNLRGFNITNCDAFSYEGQLFVFFKIIFGVIAMAWILFLLIRKYLVANPEFRRQILLMGVGIESFLFTFFTINFLAGYLTEIGILQDSRIEMFGLFGMAIFMAFISYMIVTFNVFNIKLIAAQALIVGLTILIGSELFFTESQTNFILICITLILTLFGGYLLVRSVKREIEQRQQIEKLAKNLERANAKLKVLDKMKSEFVSIASHQLRSPLTSIRGYASMLLEGSYGKLPAKVGEAIEHINDASRFMASSVEDYLNVSRIQAGNMKYEYSDFNLKDIAERVADDTRQSAIHKGLLLTFKSDVSKKGIVHADVGKTRQIIDNLVNNSLKYTPQGSIQVFVHDDPRKKKIFVDVIDTGIGMAPLTIESLFEKFERAHNANEVNVTGTGLGLYIARKMARDMGGDVTAHSAGEGKGSTFTLEMPEVL